jgi:twitching motility two-component system response regulator PilH
MLLQQAKKTVLIADDSAVERANLSAIVEGAGYQVIVVSSGDEAIAQAAGKLPKLIFLDIMMGDTDGFKTCRSIHRNPATKEIPIIMVSSKNNKADKVWAAEQGAVSYIVKPYTPDQILEALRQFG